MASSIFKISAELHEPIDSCVFFFFCVHILHKLNFVKSRKTTQMRSKLIKHSRLPKLSSFYAGIVKLIYSDIKNYGYVLARKQP